MNIQEDENYLKLQKISLNPEKDVSYLFKAFQTKIASIIDSLQDLQVLSNKSIKLCKVKESLHLTHMISNDTTAKDENSHQKYKNTYFLNNNKSFLYKSSSSSCLTSKTLKDYIKSIFEKMKLSINRMVNTQSLFFNEYNMYAKSEEISIQSKNFLITFFPMDRNHKIIIVLTPLSEEDPFLSLYNNYFVENRLLATMSHELRAPLNSITNMLQLMHHDLQEKSGDSAPHHEYLNNAIINSELLLSSINDFLDYFSIISNNYSLEINEFNVKSLIYETLSIFHSIASKKSVEFYLDYDDVIPKISFNDARRIKQILINLFNNSLRSTDNGRLEVKIKQKYDFLEISIKDTGLGFIPSEDFFYIVNLDNKHFQNRYNNSFSLYISNQLVNSVAYNE